MKNLKNILVEGLLGDIEDTLNQSDTAVAHKLIQNYLEQNYIGKWRISKKPDTNDGKYIVNSMGEIKCKSCGDYLTNNLFKWGKVKRFYIKYPYNLLSLEGSPKIVEEFACLHANKLTDLTGGPEEVDKLYNVSGSSIKSLKGAPKSVYGDFKISGCNQLIDLTGGPEEVVGKYSVSCCDALQTLKGAPKYVGDTFDCTECHLLTSLEGGLNEVLHLHCELCPKLKSLKGAPKIIHGSLCADYTGIEKLDANIESVGRNFSVCYCKNLVDLTGAPKYIGDTFDASFCPMLTSFKGLEKSEIGTLSCVKSALHNINDVLQYCPKVHEYIDLHFNALKPDNDTKEQLKIQSGCNSIII